MLLPVAVNNLYGDPAIQKENTLRKLRVLAKDPWCGPVGLITKGSYSIVCAAEIRSAAPEQLVVLISISSLTTGSEPVSVKARLKSIANFANCGVPVIGYARPILGTPEDAVSLVHSMYDHGARAVVVSGFRGSPELGDYVGVCEPSISVKEMPSDVARALKEEAEAVFWRTSCGVAHTLGLKRSWNPYWNAPKLAGCGTCPLKSTCFEAPSPPPNPTGLRVLAALGYELEKIPGSARACTILPQDRRSCPSCCTTCYLHPQGGYKLSRIDRRKPNLGELSFARHVLGGVLVFSPGVVDGGDPRVGVVDPPNPIGPFATKRIRALNTWISYSNQVNRCFGCPYCFSPYYQNELGEYGCLPSEIMQIND